MSKDNAADFFNPISGEAIPPPSGNSEFELNTGWWMAKFSQLAYKEIHYVKDALESVDCTQLIFFENKDTEAFLAKFETYAVLAFRGTENDYFDIVQDISFFKRPIQSELSGKYYRVHGGFLSALQNVWGTPPPPSSDTIKHIETLGRSDGIANVLARDEFKYIPLYITGHSLGGALASVAAFKVADTKTLPKNLTAVYTYGSPRVFDKKMASDYKIPNHRVVYGDDLVTHLPFFLGFRHIQGRYRLKPEDNIQNMDKAMFDALMKEMSEKNMEDDERRADNDVGWLSLGHILRFVIAFFVIRNTYLFELFLNLLPTGRIRRLGRQKPLIDKLIEISNAVIMLSIITLLVIGITMQVVVTQLEAGTVLGSSHVIPVLLLNVIPSAVLGVFLGLILGTLLLSVFVFIFKLIISIIFGRKVGYDPIGTKHHMIRGYINALELNYHQGK